MKGNVFSKWLQEFCSLVFVQTIQAFVLAMIMTVVISALTNGSSDSSTGNSDVLYSTGILAIIALASISKIELLVKQIFGLGGGLGDKASMGEGKKGLLGGLLALQMAKKSFDNVPKIASGAMQTFRANRDIKNEELKRADKYRRIQRRYGMDGNDYNGGAQGASDSANAYDGANGYTGAGAGGQGNNGSPAGRGVPGGNGAPGGRGVPRGNGAPGGRGGYGGYGGQGSYAGAGAGAGANNNQITYEEKIEALNDSYTQKIKELKDKRREGIKNMVSGASETALDIGGGITFAAGKAVIDGAEGKFDLGNIAKATGTGIGLADTVAKTTVNAGFGVRDLAEEIKDTVKIRQQYNLRATELERLNNEIKSVVDAGNI